jgi:PBP1b-binding outer membrane lipoprotein LpoB
MKKRFFVIILLMLIAVFLIGCASTEISTVRNPELYNTKFENILVVVPFTDIGLRRQTEGIFVSKFNSSDMKALSSLELMPPVKEYSNQELMNILDKNKVDGILTVALKDYWTSESYVPKSSSTQGSANLYGNSLYYRSYTQQYGGYYVSKPNVSFETRLFDRSSGEVAWLVSSTTSGNAFADYGNLASSLAKKVVSELKKEDMLVFSPTEIKATETSGKVSSQREIIEEKDTNKSPVIEFVAEPRTGNAPLEVFFDASASHDPDGKIETYQWDFKDGNKGNGKTIQHTFNSNGFYNVELTITDEQGSEATITIMIIVRS